MKQYRLKQCTPAFITFMDDNAVPYELLGGMEAYVYAHCDQDIFDLGKLWQQKLDGKS
jgi:hypothetical protein